MREMEINRRIKIRCERYILGKDGNSCRELKIIEIIRKKTIEKEKK